MAQYRLSEISGLLNAELTGKNNSFHNISIDSRTVFNPKDTIFVAIKGDQHNGHDFVRSLINQGVECFIIDSKLPFSIQDYKDIGVIHVNDSLKALQDIVAHHRKRFNYPVIGITGSNGKTIVKEWIFHCLADQFNIIRNPRSYNSQVGVPLSVWNMSENNNLGIFEAGISKPGEMENLENIIQPETGIITNIGPAHQQNFNNLEEKIREKLHLFKNCKIIIFSGDHDKIIKELHNAGFHKTKHLFSWGKKESNDLQLISINKNNNRSTIRCKYQQKQLEFTIPYNDEASIENALHCISTCLVMKAEIRGIMEKVKDLPGIEMRLDMKRGINNCTLINDSYNSDLNSLSIAINFLKSQNQHKKKTLILSDILQSGQEEAELYAEVAALVKQFEIDRLIGIGSTIKKNQELFNCKKTFFNETQEFLDRFFPSDFENEAILLKGSRKFRFELISARLEEKIHRTVLEINLNALVNNLNYYKSLIDQKTKLMVMVKATSYGSGTFEIANVLQFNRVDYLGVAFADEGVKLRNQGIQLPIIVMNPELSSLDTCIDFNLEPEIYNFKILDSFSKVLERKGVPSYPIHIKIDTGMHRLGFTPDEIDRLIQKVNDYKSFRIQSVFSHLAASDEKQHDDFTKYQIDLFDKLSDKLMRTIAPDALRHILNSSGIERHPQAQFDMVRLGIGLYGIGQYAGLEIVSTLKTVVLQIKNIRKNETIGYNRLGKAHKDLTIAILPIGYADGLRRELSNGLGEVLINGLLAKIIGNICMDMCMVDITHINNVNEGDDVIVFGPGNPVQKMAKKLNTIPYEIFTSIPDRVKRVYFQE